jgi:hypothetical protein
LGSATDRPADFARGLCGGAAWRYRNLCVLWRCACDRTRDAPHPQYDFASYLIVIYSAYAPTQIPIAIGEMLIPGLALRHALRQRPEVLEDLNVWPSYATA